MNKQEYMEDLKRRLCIFRRSLSGEIMEDYEEHFRVGMSRGKSEELICDELGDVTEMIEEIKELQGYTGQTFAGAVPLVQDIKPQESEQKDTAPQSLENKEEDTVQREIKQAETEPEEEKTAAVNPGTEEAKSEQDFTDHSAAGGDLVHQ